MSQEKSQFRIDMEARVMAGKSLSQKYRHALYELWVNIADDNRPATFEEYYDDKINQEIQQAMFSAENAFKFKNG